MKLFQHTVLLSGTLLMVLAIIIGAFGAHALEPVLLSNDRQDVFATASQYHFYHALGVLLVGLIFTIKPTFPKQRVIFWLMLAGIVIFSGSLYLLSILNLSWLGAITPIGGALLIASWSTFAFYLIKMD